MLEDKSHRGVVPSIQVHPSRNVNNASQTSQIAWSDIPDELLPQDGVRVSLGVSAFETTQIGDRQSLTFKLNLGSEIYSVDTLDQKHAQFGLSWDYLDSRNRASVELFAGKVWGDGELYATQYISTESELESEAIIINKNEDYVFGGFSSSVERRLRPDSLLGVSATYFKRNFESEEDFGYADSKRSNWRLYFQRELREGFFATAWFARTRYLEAGSDGSYKFQNNYIGKEYGVSMNFVPKDSIHIGASISQEKRAYDLPHNYTFGEYARDETTRSMRINFSHPRFEFKGLKPALRCTYFRNEANIEDFDRESSGCGIHVKRTF